MTFRTGLNHVPSSVRPLIREFRDELLKTLDNNLVGAYLHGSIAFPEFQPRAGDIDFYVVVKRILNKNDRNDLDHLHGALAHRFLFGKKLDGFYIPVAQAKRRKSPRGLVYAAHGRLHQGGLDDAWSLHRAHFHRSAYIALHGPRASKIFPPASWPEIRKELYKQLHYARSIISKDSAWAVLNLCRLIYSFVTRTIAVSKMRAAKWGLKNLPSRWRPLIRSAINAYRDRTDRRDQLPLRKNARAFLGFASVQIIAYDSTENPPKSPITYHRKTSSKGRKEQ